MREAVCSIILFLTLLTLPHSNASETDGFTVRYEDFEEGISSIDQEVNQRINLAIELSNTNSTDCSLSTLQNNLKKLFLRRLYGKIEGFINSSPLVPKKSFPLSESIYKYIPTVNNLPAHLWSMGFGSMVHAHSEENLLLIGADKFGHFFDQGFQYYNILLESNHSLTDAFALGDHSEEGIFGLVTTGVKSYADLVANFQGLQFWSNMLIPVIADANPYLKCVKDGELNSHWEVVRKFTFTEYIDAGWDEAINCNQYRNLNYEIAVNLAINELKDKFPNKRFDCPVIPGACISLKEKYGSIAYRLIHPNCLNEKSHY